MGFIVSVALGAILGWLASIVMRVGTQQHIVRDILIGIMGALLGGFFFGPLMGGGNLLESSLDIRTLLVATLGALILLAAVLLFRRQPGALERSRDSG